MRLLSGRLGGAAVVALLLCGGCGSEERGSSAGLAPALGPVGDGGAAGARSRAPTSRPASQPSSGAAPTSVPASGPASGPASAPLQRSAAARALESRCRAIVDAMRAGTPLTADQRSTVAWQRTAGGRPGRTARQEFVDAQTCLAVGRNDERSCSGLAGGEAETCRRAVRFYRWARKPTPDRSWRCDAQGLKKASGKGISRAQFEAMCAALRSGDPSRCPDVKGEAADGCRAEVALDPSLCHGREHCVQEIERTKTILSGGLAARLPAAKDQEKLQIEAALHGEKACSPTLDELRFACGVDAPTPAAPKAPTK